MSISASRPAEAGEPRHSTSLTPTAARTLTDLLAVGAERPITPVGLVDSLRATIEEGTAAAVARWSGAPLFVTKSMVGTALRCEGHSLADASLTRTQGMSPYTAAGLVTHRAIQLAHTHPHRALAEYVEHAISGLLTTDSKFEGFWAQAGMGGQSDLRMAAMSKVTLFLDSFPPLAPEWTPRFEEPFSAKLAGMTLSARADLVLGRPRADMRQTMFFTDLKSGMLREEHVDEAMFYALVAALRYGIAPFRSTVYSLSTGEWTDPDVTSARLTDAAGRVVAAVNAVVETRSEARPPVLTAGRHCAWCPLLNSCPAAAQEEGLQQGAGLPVQRSAPAQAAPATTGPGVTSAPAAAQQPDPLTAQQAQSTPATGGENPWAV